jgi:heme exporter protein B
VKGWLRVAAKDVRVELRSRDTLVPVALTGLLVVVVGVLAFHDVEDRAVVAAGVIWMGLAFAAATGLARSFLSERDRGTLDTLLALPLERSSLYLGKAAAGLATLLVVALLALPTYLLASGDPVPAQWPGLLLVVVLGCAGLAAAGTMLSLLAAHARSRDLLMPVLLFPLVVPVLIATTHGTLDVLRGAPFAEWQPEVLLLLGYDVAIVAVSALLFEQAV